MVIVVVEVVEEVELEGGLVVGGGCRNSLRLVKRLLRKSLRLLKSCSRRWRGDRGVVVGVGSRGGSH